VSGAGAALLDANGFTGPITFDTAATFQFTPLWNWLGDLNAGRIDGLGNTSHGALFTTVQGPPLSARDASAKLRDAFKIVDLPGWVAFPQGPGQGSQGLPVPCNGPGCLPFFDPSLWLRDPEFLDFGEKFLTPVVLSRVDSSLVAWYGGKSVDITANFTEGLLANFDSPNTAWLTPVEPSSDLRRLPNRGGLQAVVVPRTISPEISVQQVVRTEGGLVEPVIFEPPDGLQGLAANGSPPIGPRARTGAQPLLSGVERSVYFVGGIDSETGAASQAVWRYELATGAWRFLFENAREVPSSDVLSVAYDQARGRLFVLDVSDDIIGKKLRFARLLRFDVQEGTSQVLATWPYIGVAKAHFIIAAGNGDVLLSLAMKNVFTTYRLGISESGVEWRGIHVAQGSLLGPPMMGEFEPHVAFLRKGKGKGNVVEYLELGPSLFKGHHKCGAL
jgi:hypothetical protein